MNDLNKDSVQSQKSYNIYGLGAALVDTEIEVSDAELQQLSIPKGVMTLVDEPRQAQLLQALADHLPSSKLACGGSAANSIIGASYLGCTTFYSCRVANDDNGQFYLNDLNAAGVSFKTGNGSINGVTGKCLVLITPDAERTMNTFLGISESVNITDIDEIALADSDYAYIEGYLVTSATGKPTAIRLRELAEQHNVKVAFSLSDPAIVEYFYDGLVDMIGTSAELLFCNEAEAIAFTKTSHIDEAFAKLKTVAKTFAITCGASGARLFDGNNDIHVTSPKVKAIDSNGAGDMFAGAFLASLSQGKSFEYAGAFGCFAAAQVVSQFGPRLSAEQYAQLESQFEEKSIKV